MNPESRSILKEQIDKLTAEILEKESEFTKVQTQLDSTKKRRDELALEINALKTAKQKIKEDIDNA